METGVNHLGWISHYTPISDDLKGHYGKAPEYYGLQAFAYAGKGDMVQADCQPAASIAPPMPPAIKTASASPHQQGPNQDAEVTISGVSAEHGEAMRLTGTALGAKDGVKLGKRESMNPQAVHVPAGSAALVWLKL